MIRERWFMRRIERQDARVVVIVDRTTGAGFTVHADFAQKVCDAMNIAEAALERAGESDGPDAA
jgi:hypothetical protein